MRSVLRSSLEEEENVIVCFSHVENISVDDKWMRVSEGRKKLYLFVEIFSIPRDCINTQTVTSEIECFLHLVEKI